MFTPIIDILCRGGRRHGAGGGGSSFIASSSRFTIYHASLSKRSIVSTPKKRQEGARGRSYRANNIAIMLRTTQSKRVTRVRRAILLSQPTPWNELHNGHVRAIVMRPHPMNGVSSCTLWINSANRRKVQLDHVKLFMSRERYCCSVVL